MTEPWDSLRQAGWPIDQLLITENSSDWVGRDLLTVLRNAARTATAVGRFSLRQRQFLQRLQMPPYQTAQLTWGWPNRSSLVTPRLLWWPAVPPVGRRVAVLSSHLGRRLDEHDSWFEMLCRVCAGLDRNRDVLLTCKTMAADRFVRHCGAEYGLRTVSLQLPPARQKLVTWVRQFGRCPVNPSGNDIDWPVRISPRLSGEPDVSPEGRPLADWLVGRWVDEIHVLYVRPNGWLKQLLHSLIRSESQPERIYLSRRQGAIPSRLRDELYAAGAMDADAICDEKCLKRINRPVVPLHRRVDSQNLTVRSQDPDEEWDYLIHWTRRQAGPWPDQSEFDYVRELLFDVSVSDRSALAALRRILVTQCIVATNRLTRGRIPVVCLTERNLDELADCRIFRRHQQRWDFELYGLCIDRHWLIGRGARPVIYGDDRLWNELPTADQPFFQLSQTRSACGAAPIDWTSEREWRIVGDIDLRQLPDSSGRVFVPTHEVARQVICWSRWPLIVIQ